MPSRINRPVIYLDEIDVLVIHAKIIEATGGSEGVREINLVKGAMARPQSQVFGKELFVSVFEKAASYFDSISRNHPFVDGNKRTAFALAVRFLYLNSYEFNASNKQIELYVVEAVERHHEIKEVASWFEEHSKYIE